MNNTTDLLDKNTASEELTRQLNEKNPLDQLTAAAGEIAPRIVNIICNRPLPMYNEEVEDVKKLISTNPTLLAMANELTESCRMREFFEQGMDEVAKERNELKKELEFLKGDSLNQEALLEQMKQALDERDQLKLLTESQLPTIKSQADTIKRLNGRVREFKSVLEEIANLTAGNSRVEPNVNDRCILNLCDKALNPTAKT